MIFNAVQTIKERRQARSAVKANRNYSCEEDDIFLHLTSMDRIKSLVANNEELATNAVPMDINFWKSIGNSRKFASCNDMEWLAKMLYTQTYKNEVSSPEPSLRGGEEEEEEEEEDGVEDEQEDDDDNEEEVSHNCTRNASLVNPYLRMIYHQDDEGVDEEEDDDEDDDDEDDDYVGYECDKKSSSPPISLPIRQKRPAEEPVEEPVSKAAKVAESTEAEDKTKVAVKALLKAQQLLISKADLEVAGLVSEALVALM